jgi:hypothetical protein
MRIFPAPVQIGSEEGFTPDKDIFARREFGASLANLVFMSDDPLVILLDSPWGTGKTTFLNMWAGELRKSKVPVIYFDAFLNDHVDDAFLAIASEVIRLAGDLKKTKESAYKSFVKKAGRVGGILLRTSARVGVKAATLGAIDAADLDSLKKVASDVAKDTSTLADDYVESLLKLQSREKETLASLRDALAGLAESFGESQEGQVRTCPLVFIIDELDRCRPSFALEVLERIKHIFSIPNVHFVLSAQLSQLENSVRYSYGPDIDALTYLQKFYNVTVHFPEPRGGRHEGLIAKFLAHLRTALPSDRDALAVVGHLAEARGLSFRAIERIATCLALARASTPKNYLWVSPIVSVLCVMKIIEPKLFRSAREKKISVQGVEKFLALGTQSAEAGTLNVEYVIGWWKYCLMTEEPDRMDPEYQPYRHHLFQYSVARQEIVALMASYLDNFQSPAV